ncbi:MAG: HNH endonuclease [Balneolaceae bacterium]|jgi:putative restriction endonuclease
MTQEEVRSSIQNLNANKDSTTWDHRTRQLAPHKPFLLLSIIDGIEIGWIKDAQITLSQDLIETFFRYWKQIMGEDRKTTIALPFFHMNSEPFWDLQYKEGKTPYKNSPSLGGLIDRVDYAKIDDQLFAMMKDQKEEQAIISIILQHYFSDELLQQILDIHHINIGAYQYAQQLELLAAEPFIKYHADKDSESYSWQKTQKRRQGFGLKVRENYDHRCAICRSRVRTQNGESLVEGAHIIPWNKSKNDDPRNGLALCKTHHWMFDAYLLTIQPDYHIKLSTWLKEEGEKIDKTLAWDREEILLPGERRFLPSVEALEERYEQFNKH